MCSITFDSLLIRRGIPINSIGGGVVEIENRTPIRFTHLILYEHTTIDPLQVLLSQKITSVTNVMRQGSGNILANIREFHMEAEPLVGMVLDDLASSSYSGILEVGIPNIPLLGVPVSPQYIAIAAVGGTNPLAAIREGGRWVQAQAMKGLMEIGEMSEIRQF
jgi:repressor of nif and glnA expression